MFILRASVENHTRDSLVTNPHLNRQAFLSLMLEHKAEALPSDGWYKLSIKEVIAGGKIRNAVVHICMLPDESIAHRVVHAKNFGAAENNFNGPTEDPWRWAGEKLGLWSKPDKKT